MKNEVNKEYTINLATMTSTTMPFLYQVNLMNDDLKVRMDKAENIRKDLEQRINELLSAVGGSS